MISGYRKTFAYESIFNDNRVFLHFDGAAHKATVYFNGKELLKEKDPDFP